MKKKSKVFFEKRDIYLKAAFRKIWRWSKERREVLKRAGGKCEQCGKRKKDIVVDHVDPVVDPRVGFVGWDAFYGRLFVPVDKMQGLCKTCHTIKTKQENAERRKAA